jgi:methionyl-tRNA synthetase
MISIDDFRKVELRVATITSAEPHPNADKLMVLQIDLGGELRQICAGIRNHYTAEELVGKQIIVVANLETAKLRGLESQGMLLAASDDERVIVLTPDKSVQAISHFRPSESAVRITDIRACTLNLERDRRIIFFGP